MGLLAALALVAAAPAATAQRPPSAGQTPTAPTPPLSAVFASAPGPGALGCYRSPTLLSTGSTLLAIAAHHWDTATSPCNDVGLKAIVVRASTDGVRWSPQRLIFNDSLPSRWPGHDGISMGTALWDNHTRTVFLILATCSHVPGRAAPAPAHCPHSKLLLRSTSEGRSWSAPKNITAQLGGIPGIWAPGPATGIQLADGRLLGAPPPTTTTPPHHPTPLVGADS